MFDVLMYLFETYIHTEAELRVDQDKLEQDLTDAGFDREDIYNALLWLEKLADYQEEQNEDHNNVDHTGIDYQADTIYVRFKDTAPAEAVGQLADTILVLDSVKDAIVISNNLIKKVDGTKVVYVLKNGEKTAVEVETGLSTGSQTEIKSGLKEGDEIVIR